jgi:hypothetical protein
MYAIATILDVALLVMSPSQYSYFQRSIVDIFSNPLLAMDDTLYSMSNYIHKQFCEQ